MNKKLIAKELNSLTADYTAEAMAAEIIDNGVNLDSIYFKNISTFQRFISKDVEKISWETDAYDVEKLVLELNREGLYDMLPDGLIHPPASASTTEETLDVMEMQRGKEELARKFFGVFENEFHHAALKMEIIERELFNNRNDASNRVLFEYLYSDSTHLNDKQVLSLLYILPLTNKIRGDERQISTVLSKILDYKIVVEKTTRKVTHTIPDMEYARLGSSDLGVDSVLSGPCSVLSYCYDIVIHDVAPEDYKSFIINGKHNNVITYLMPYLFPSDTEVNVVLLTTESNKYLKSSADEVLCFLGFNSYI